MNMYPCTLKCIRYPPKLIQFMWLEEAQPTRERSQQMTSAGKGGEIDWLPNGDLLAKTKKELVTLSIYGLTDNFSRTEYIPPHNAPISRFYAAPALA